MALTFKSIDAATAADTFVDNVQVGLVGGIFSFNQPRSNISFQFITTGNPATVSGTIQGSIDGINFTHLSAFSTPYDGGFLFSTGKPLIAVRPFLGAISNNATVTVWIAVDN